MSANRHVSVCRRRLLSRVVRLSLTVAGPIMPATFVPSARAAEPSPASPAASLDRTSPLNKEIADGFAAIDREVARLRQAGLSTRADEFAARLATLRARAAAQPLPARAAAPDDQPELHVVGVYEGALPGGGGQRGFRQHVQGAVSVDVKITDRPLVLTLCAYEPVKWRLDLAPGAHVQRVILSGYYAQELADPPAGAAVEILTYDARSPEYFYAYTKDSPSYARAADILAAKTNLPVATFQGQYRPKAPFVLDASDPSIQRQRILADLEPVHREATAFARAQRCQESAKIRFPALYWEPDPRRGFMNPRGQLADFTPSGPIADTLKPPPLPGSHHQARLALQQE